MSSEAQPASRETLQELHRLLTDVLLEYMRNPPNGKYRASFLELIRAFLADNGIRKDVVRHKDVQAALEDLRDTEIPFVLPSMAR